ncbi:toxin regulator [Terrisporobacter mayombei]|uniref:Toxin regulator n=1 Tax=Terrisporobacter mayombei TaxID=1541 RepID=A0ABY9PZT0_9FIRM|nr:toxin regulator [Terrisporobacter mayombei]WMT81216.1 hypothetical protein TEMA_15500 [Terrisporobacter mayombei]
MNMKDNFNKFRLKIKEELKNQTDINFSIKGTVKVILKIIVFFIVISFFILCSENVAISDNYDSLVNDYNSLVKKYNNLSEENEELKSKLDEAKPWFEMKKEEQKAIEQENEKREAKEQAKKKAEEEQEKRKAEEKEKKGYDTGIGYKDLARNPKDYVGEKIKFKGKVVQVMEGDGEVQVRLAVNGDYDNIMYCVYNSSIVTSRVLEDDYITVMGKSSDLITYTSTMGGEITIPSMMVEKIDM